MSLIVEIKAVPSSGKLQLFIDKSGNIKCFLKNSPENGKANSELIKFISKQLNIAQQQVSIISGATSRKKKIKIETQITLDQFLSFFGIEKEKQQNFLKLNKKSKI